MLSYRGSISGSPVCLIKLLFICRGSGCFCLRHTTTVARSFFSAPDKFYHSLGDGHESDKPSKWKMMMNIDGEACYCEGLSSLMPSDDLTLNDLSRPDLKCHRVI